MLIAFHYPTAINFLIVIFIITHTFQLCKGVGKISGGCLQNRHIAQNTTGSHKLRDGFYQYCLHSGNVRSRNADSIELNVLH